MKQNSRYSNLANNSILFAIGNLGSQLVKFLLLPLYTYQLTTQQFGTADLIVTTVSLLLPIVSLNIFDAVLRFSLDKEVDSVKIFSNALAVSILSSLLLLLCLPLTYFFNISFIVYVPIILIVQIFQSLFSYFAKAIGEVKTFAINGIILSFLTALANILLLVMLDLGIVGYLLSIIFANIVSNIWLWFKLDLFHMINVRLVKKSEIVNLLRYCLPLIPNSIAWWINSMIDRYFILIFLDIASNGIFAVASRIPSLIGVLNSIFFQAWQISAIEEYDSEDKSDFYSSVFSLYSKFIFIGTSIILLILRPLMSILVSTEYGNAWKYVPFLLVTVVYSSFSSFFGNYYAVAKKTGSIFSTTVIGAIVNIVANSILIPIFGLSGAGIASAIGFLVVLLIRIKDTRKFISTDIDKLNILLNHIVLFGQIYFLFYLEDIFLYIIQSLFVFISLIINKKVFLSALQLLKNN